MNKKFKRTAFWYRFLCTKYYKSDTVTFGQFIAPLLNLHFYKVLITTKKKCVVYISGISGVKIKWGGKERKRIQPQF